MSRCPGSATVPVKACPGVSVFTWSLSSTSRKLAVWVPDSNWRPSTSSR